MIIIGIDPGRQGAFAIYDTETKSEYAIKMPVEDADIASILRPYSECDVICFVEKLTYADASGKVNQTAIGKLAQNRGHILGACSALNMKTIEVTPQKWQKALDCGARKFHATPSKWKNHLKSIAQKIYPKTKVTLANGDALLIMTYGHMVQFNGSYPQ